MHRGNLHKNTAGLLGRHFIKYGLCEQKNEYISCLAINIKTKSHNFTAIVTNNNKMTVSGSHFLEVLKLT